MKTVIIYATKHGCSEKCAKWLAEKLSGTVDLHNLKMGDGVDLAQYDRVILGGSIYAGRMLKEVTAFCQNRLDQLKGKRLGLFTCGMNQKEADAQLKANYPEELLERAVVADCFGGEYNLKEMNFFEKTIVKMVARMEAKENYSEPPDLSRSFSAVSEEKMAQFAQKLS